MRWWPGDPQRGEAGHEFSSKTVRVGAHLFLLHEGFAGGKIGPGYIGSEQAETPENPDGG